MTCQKAIDKHTIPASLAKRKDDRYVLWELKDYLGLHTSTVHKLVRQGKLKSRIIPDNGGRVHCELFLIKDNPGMLPRKPKYSVKQVGERTYTTEREDIQLPAGLKAALGK